MMQHRPDLRSMTVKAGERTSAASISDRLDDLIVDCVCKSGVEVSLSPPLRVYVSTC